MAPVTRSSGKAQTTSWSSPQKAQASSSKVTLDNDDWDTTSDETSVRSGSPERFQPIKKASGTSGGTTLQSLLTRALGGVKELERENATLRKTVAALEARLDRVVEADDAPLQPRKAKRLSAATVLELRREVESLRKQVRRLEKTNEKQRKRIHQLSMKELKTEAEDLVDVAEFEVGDSAHKMRNLLRRFQDLMLENALDENEECDVCEEPLEVKKCRSFPCQHILCEDCTLKLLPDPHKRKEELIRCPQCRMQCPRDETETIRFTAVERWDALLDVAKQWARMDTRRHDDTTEEEDAESFLDDGPEETSTTASERPSAHPLESTAEPEGGDEEKEVPQTPYRLRKRPAVTTPISEQESEPVAEPEHHLEPKVEPAVEDLVPEIQPDTDEVPDVKSEADTEHEDQTHSPVTPSASVQRTPSYAQSPSQAKRKRLEQLAEARNKKRRL
ncbi:hypothetical protein BV20DRAFT_1051563 [Pilatotrama ljubarskyi]|nr:hypothetical protein BV20DRAFT_1051563 [Pilatotrama ljubarskyi]